MIEKVDRGRFSYKKVRKHISQMSVSEKSRARRMFTSVKQFKILDHVNDRILEKGYSITIDDIIDLMRSGDIVEYEQKLYTESGKLSHMLVIKNRRVTNGNDDILHMVFDMTSQVILTVWVNSSDDLHDTLDMGIYSKGLKVGENYWEN